MDSMLEAIKVVGSILNVVIIPAFVYIVKIEKRLARGDEILKAVKKDCPIYNLGHCPSVERRQDERRKAHG
jgi:hypothetical protein